MVLVDTKKYQELRAMVLSQANDEGLWFRAKTAPEAYLMQELRKLHALVEAMPPRGSHESVTSV